jgi:hypothetical protein
MTKEAILESYLGNYAGRFGGSVTIDLFCSMDDYAKSQAIAFVKWVFQKGYIKNPAGDVWYDGAKLIGTTEELYGLFLTHQSQHK